LQFQTARYLFAGLHAVERIDQVPSYHIALRQVIKRGRQQGAASRRLVLEADFVLFAFGRLEGVAVEVGGGLWQERLRVTGVGRHAVVEQVERAELTGGGGVAGLGVDAGQ